MIKNITTLYGKCGYIDSLIDYIPEISEECETLYNLHITIDEGSQYRVGLIKIIGNHTTNTRVILHETLLVPGELLDIRKMQITERRLANIGYFDQVNVYAVQANVEEGCDVSYRDIHIEVIEGSTAHFGAFAGYSTQESAFTGLNFVERNFDISGLSNIFSEGYHALRGGGEFFSLTSTFGGKSRRYNLSWTKPYYNDTPWSIGFDVEKANNRYISPNGYDIDSLGFTGHATYPHNAFMKSSYHYRLTYSDLRLAYDPCTTRCNLQPGECFIFNRKLEEQAKNSGLISAIGGTWIYDSTNHPLTPTSGGKSRFEAEFAGIGGTAEFISFGYVNSYYHDLKNKGTLLFRADFKFIQPLFETNFDTIPVEERLFLGGNTLIRGFKPFFIGPQYEIERVCKETNGETVTIEGYEPKGGISMQFLSLEYSYPLFSRLDVFTYIDAGHLDDRAWGFGKMYTAVGVGCRIQIYNNSPPLMIGWGYPLNQDNSDDVKNFFMTMGGAF
jgi:outer membrane protein insertion porin family